MEILLLAVLLSAAQNGKTDLSAALRDALAFYRENRELMGMLAGMLARDGGASVPFREEQTPPREDAPPQTSQKNDRPPDDAAADLNVFEEYFRQLHKH